MTGKSFIFSIETLAKHLRSQLKLGSSETSKQSYHHLLPSPKTMSFALVPNQDLQICRWTPWPSPRSCPLWSSRSSSPSSLRRSSPPAQALLLTGSPCLFSSVTSASPSTGNQKKEKKDNSNKRETWQNKNTKGQMDSHICLTIKGWQEKKTKWQKYKGAKGQRHERTKRQKRQLWKRT